MAATDRTARAPLRIFCSYAHTDYAFCQQLRTSLAGLKRLGYVEIWSDHDLSAGRTWNPEIQRQLEQADVIVFLVSYACCDSDYIMDVEYPRAVQRAREDGTAIIPFLVTDVDYEGTPFAELDPRVKHNGVARPVQRWRPRHAPFSAVAREIRELVESRANPAEPPPASQLPAGFWAPRRERVVGRQGVIDRIAAALRGLERGSVALVGGGGVGKTTIALEYAWQYGAEYNLVAWLHAEDQTTLTTDYVGMAERVGVAATDRKDARDAFRQWLATHSGWLIVFDNATDPHTVRELLPERIGGHVLITSREPDWWQVAAEIPVDRLPRDDAVTLLRDLTGDPDTEAAGEIADLVHGIPLALNDAVKAVNEGTSLRAYLDENRGRLAPPVMP